MEVHRDSPFSSAVFWEDLLEELQDPEFLAHFAEELRSMPADKLEQILQMIQDQQLLRSSELQESIAQMHRGEGKPLDPHELKRRLDSEVADEYR